MTPRCWPSVTGSSAIGHRQRAQGVQEEQHVIYDIKYIFPADQVDGRL